MDDDRAGSDSGPSRDEPATARPTPKRPRKKGLMILGIVVLLPLLVLTLWTAITLRWSYSQGTRTGYIQKFSKKGWLCKTWEGELAIGNVPGSVPQLFTFSVRSESVASEITKKMGSRVSLTYEEHRGIPTSCFGDTGYFVTGATAVP